MQEQSDRSMVGKAVLAPISVVIVSYCSADVIEGCLDSLYSSTGISLRVAVCDNASPDDSAERITSWARRNGVSFTEVKIPEETSRKLELPWLTLLKAPRNLGFAGGVNAGLSWFLPHSEIGLFWILNPDCEAEPETAAAFARCAQETGKFALMGGRIRYMEPPGFLQTDGGHVHRWTGVCVNVHRGYLPTSVEPPKGESLDFIPGANIVASREFIETTGLMREDYFLYYEEVDWAFQRRELPLAICSQAVVHHHGGTAIGSGVIGRSPSAFANYFNFRNRLRFVARFFWPMLPFAYAYSMLKIFSIALKGEWRQAAAALRGLHQVSPPLAVAARVAPESRELAFGRWGRVK